MQGTRHDIQVVSAIAVWGGSQPPVDGGGDLVSKCNVRLYHVTKRDETMFPFDSNRPMRVAGDVTNSNAVITELMRVNQRYMFISCLFLGSSISCCWSPSGGRKSNNIITEHRGEE